MNEKRRIALAAAIIAVVLVAVIWATIGRHFLMEAKARRLLGTTEAILLAELGPPDQIITIDEINDGMATFPPRGFILLEPAAVTSKVLLYQTITLGYICVFINEDGKVGFVTRAVS